MGGIFRKRSRSSQLGFTLIELMIAIALGGVILAGSAALLRQIVISGGDSSDRTQARLEVQYVNFWVSEDVIQAQEVQIGDISAARCPTPFLTLKWTAEGVNNTVTYCVEDVKDKLGRSLWKLYRSKGVGQITVAENLDPLLTRCYQKQSGNGTSLNVLVLEVASKVDRMEASASYEISPRFGNVTWTVAP
jgi:prepilin-type N-terminal cleavage/methylation domain-containing protein